MAARSALQATPGNGPDFVARLLHEFVWCQGLPNTNHRSSILLADQLLFVDATEPPSEDHLSVCRDRFWKVSKPLIHDKEFHPDPLHGKETHLDACTGYVACVNPAS